MRNKSYILAVSVALFASCSGNKSQQVTFNPEPQATVVTRSPKHLNQPLPPTEGNLALSVLVQNDLNEVNAELLRSKFLSIITYNGLASVGVTPQFVLAPVLTEVDYEVTATLPSKHKVNYNAIVYLGNVITGEVFGSVTKALIGVGDSKDLALRSAIASFSAQDEDFANLIRQSEQKIVDYYQTHGAQLLMEAEGYLKNKHFEEALAILNSIPKECTDLYAQASKIRFQAIDDFMQNNADVLLNDLKASLGLERDNAGGFSERAMAIYKNIPTHSKAKQEADRLYAAYLKDLNPEAKANYEQSMREWESKMKQLDRQHELDLYKTEMSTKVAIDGQTALLQKYKKDAGYHKMGWLGKFFYFGKE